MRFYEFLCVIFRILMVHCLVQREAQADTIPKDIGKMWIDPVPDGKCGNFLVKLKITQWMRNQNWKRI